MRKYTRKELRFIANHDLEILIEYIPMANEEQQKALNQVIEYATQLIKFSDQKNTKKMFEIADSVECQLFEEWNKYAEMYDRGILNQKQSQRYDEIYNLKEELNKLTNLHPDSLLTWEDVAAGYI